MSKSLSMITLCAALALAGGQALAFPQQQAAPAETPAVTAPAVAAPAVTAPAVATPPATPAATSPAPTTPKITKGTVVETMKGGGYTYVCIEKDGQKRWAAMPPTEVKVGDEVELPSGGMEMGQFTSKAMKRTFEQIYFCGGLVKPKTATGETAAPGSTPTTLPHPVQAGQGMPPGHAGMMPGGAAGAMPPGHPPTAAAPTAEQAATGKASSSKVAGKVVETFDGGGYTYALIEKDGQRSWVAVPPAKLKVGEEVQFAPGFVMNNFSSAALNRTFEAITFSSGVVKPAATPPAK